MSFGGWFTFVFATVVLFGGIIQCIVIALRR